MARDELFDDLFEDGQLAPTPFAPAALSLGQRLKLLLGRPRRLYLNLLRPDYVRRSLARRHGQCRRCGACCQMGVRCLRLCYRDGLADCNGYSRYRSPNCRNFPIDERDLAERDLVAPDTPCGYTFDGDPGRR